MLTNERKAELKDNYRRVLERIEAAKARRGGNTPVTLLAASKTMPAEDAAFLAEECGLTLCGENHAQEFRDKYAEISAAGCRMDFIGHLQSNKVKYVVGKAGLIHSLDSVRIAEEINRQAEKLGIVQNVLIEVNMGEEESKTGIRKADFPFFCDSIGHFSSLCVQGIMVMVPKSEKKDEIRKYFEESYRIFLDFCDTEKVHIVRQTSR